MVFSVNPTQDKTQAKFKSVAIQQKGGGSSVSTPAATPTEGEANASSSAATPAGSETVTPGKGTLGSDGSCTCAVSCGSNAFPVAAQGIGAFGGLPGEFSFFFS